MPVGIRLSNIRKLVKIFMNSVSHIIDLKEHQFSEKLYETLRINRYAILKNHLLNLNMLDTIYEEWENFFKNNDDLKQKYLYSHETDNGYVPMNLEYAKGADNPDLKEFYQIHLEALLNQETPCSIETKKLFQQLAELGESIVKILDNGLPQHIKCSMSAPLWESTKESKQHCMRFIHYPPCGNSHEVYRSVPHDDICLLTIILPTRGEGLRMKKNDDWSDESLDNQSLVVFNSEMLEICTNGYFQSMSHQVTTDLIDAKLLSRYSMPFAVHPHSNMPLKKDLTAYQAVRQRIVDTRLNKVNIIT